MNLITMQDAEDVLRAASVVSREQGIVRLVKDFYREVNGKPFSIWASFKLHFDNTVILFDAMHNSTLIVPESMQARNIAGAIYNEHLRKQFEKSMLDADLKLQEIILNLAFRHSAGMLLKPALHLVNSAYDLARNEYAEQKRAA